MKRIAATPIGKVVFPESKVHKSFAAWKRSVALRVGAGVFALGLAASLVYGGLWAGKRLSVGIEACEDAAREDLLRNVCMLPDSPRKEYLLSLTAEYETIRRECPWSQVNLDRLAYIKTVETRAKCEPLNFRS